VDRDASLKSLVACHECDYIHRDTGFAFWGKALCRRCGALLYRRGPKDIEKAIAFNTAALILFFLSNAFPFLSLELHGRVVENYFLSGAFQLYHLGMEEVGILVLLTSFLFPLMTTLGMLYLLVPVFFGYQPWQMARVFGMVSSLKQWALVSVFMLGVLISFVKLLDMADITPGPGFYAFAGLMVFLAAASAAFDPGLIWPMVGSRTPCAPLTGSARANGLVACHTCGLVANARTGRCKRCGTRLHSRKHRSIERTWALVIAAAMIFIPANVYPVMTVIQLGREQSSTILGGVIHFIEGGTWVLAMIIFFASIMVPVLKLVILSWLLYSVGKGSDFRPRDRTLLFRVTELIGAWSMVDVYVVAVLVGLVDLGTLSTVRPGIGVVFFGAMVVITMVAAHNFDPRLIWDNAKGAK
jgi:paraquat-inducible protein A